MTPNERQKSIVLFRKFIGKLKMKFNKNSDFSEQYYLHIRQKSNALLRKFIGKSKI